MDASQTRCYVRLVAWKLLPAAASCRGVIGPRGCSPREVRYSLTNAEAVEKLRHVLLISSYSHRLVLANLLSLGLSKDVSCHAHVT